jgi:hypothetical protein
MEMLGKLWKSPKIGLAALATQFSEHLTRFYEKLLGGIRPLRGFFKHC